MVAPREGMLSVTPEDSLYQACKLLRDNRLHRLPVLDPLQNSVLSVITHSGILEFLVATFREQRRLFDQPIFDLGIGVYSNLITVPEDMPLIRVLHTLAERRISALPIVDASGASRLAALFCQTVAMSLWIALDCGSLTVLRCGVCQQAWLSIFIAYRTSPYVLLAALRSGVGL